MREMQDRSVEFKQQRRLNCLKTKSRNKSESNREEISYKIVVTVTLDPDVLQKAVVTPQELKECKKYVPAFRKRPKKYITFPDDKKSVIGFIFVIFDTGNKLWRQPAEIIQLVTKTKTGTSFFTFTTPTKEIFSDAPHVNKFKVSWVVGNKCLYRGGNILQTVPFHDVFDYLLISLQIQRVLVTKPFSLTTSLHLFMHIYC